MLFFSFWHPTLYFLSNFLWEGIQPIKRHFRAKKRCEENPSIKTGCPSPKVRNLSFWTQKKRTESNGVECRSSDSVKTKCQSCTAWVFGEFLRLLGEIRGEVVGLIWVVLVNHGWCPTKGYGEISMRFCWERVGCFWWIMDGVEAKGNGRFLSGCFVSPLGENRFYPKKIEGWRCSRIFWLGTGIAAKNHWKRWEKRCILANC